MDGRHKIEKSSGLDQQGWFVVAAAFAAAILVVTAFPGQSPGLDCAARLRARVLVAPRKSIGRIGSGLKSKVPGTMRRSGRRSEPGTLDFRPDPLGPWLGHAATHAIREGGERLAHAARDLRTI
jgi:hypothetical protein